MKRFRFTFHDIDHPERVTVTVVDSDDERAALQEAVDQLRDTAADAAWDLLSTEDITPPENITPEEDPEA